MTEIPVIAIDGPVGTGKGTVCQRLATTLGFHVLDSGAVYRILAHQALEEGVDLADESALVQLADRLSVAFRPSNDGEPVQVWVAGKDVTEAIRTEVCGNAASTIAPLAAVRGALLALQHRFRRTPGLVADGRDMGTVVFPDATVKIFLTASAEARAQRRYKQLIGKGISVNLADLLCQIEERDRRDMERTTAPLKPAEDAVVVDTTHLSVEEVCQRILAIVSNKGIGVPLDAPIK